MLWLTLQWVWVGLYTAQLSITSSTYHTGRLIEDCRVRQLISCSQLAVLYDVVGDIFAQLSRLSASPRTYGSSYAPLSSSASI